MIILLERPEITPNIKIQIDDCIDKHEFQKIYLFEEWLNRNLKHKTDELHINKYLNFFSGFLKFHQKTDYTQTIVLENSFAWLGWVIKQFNLDKTLIQETLTNIIKDTSFKNIKTIFIVPKHDDSLDIELFQQTLKAQHDFILENYLALSDSRRRNKNYHLMAHHHNETLIPDLNKVFSKYIS